MLLRFVKRWPTATSLVVIWWFIAILVCAIAGGKTSAKIGLPLLVIGALAALWVAIDIDYSKRGA